MPISLPGKKIVLNVVTGTPVPSFKNSKRSILDRNTGKQRTLTPEKIKKRMDELERGIESALLLAYQTAGGATSTGCSLPLWIASCTPADDCWQDIPEIAIRAELAESPRVEIIVECIA